MKKQLSIFLAGVMVLAPLAVTAWPAAAGQRRH